MSLYNYILNNIYNLNNSVLDNLLIEHELNLLSEYLKRKFNDSRSSLTLKNLIKSEYGIV